MSDDAADVAKQAFTEGKDLYSEGKFDEASKKFHEAYDAKPTWKLLYNIGQTEAAAKRNGLALEAFELYLTEGGDEISVERQQEIQKEVERLRGMVGILEVDTHKGAEVFVDTISRGIAPIHGGIPVSAAKKHMVVVSYKDEVIPATSVRVMGGKTVKITMMVEPKEEIPPALAASSETDAPAEPVAPEGLNEKARQLTISGWVLTGIGGAALIAGGITGGAALGKDKDLDGICNGSQCDDSDEDMVNTRDSLALTSTIMFSAGAVFVTTGVILLVLGKKAGSERVSMVPVVGPKMAGANLGIRF